MLKKLKKFMLVAAAAVMLSAGFATVAPNEAHAAHWADKQMNWAFDHGYIKSDLRDRLATRQDTWLILTRYAKGRRYVDYDEARNYVKQQFISDGTRGTNWITRDEFVSMLYALRSGQKPWNPSNGFGDGRQYGMHLGIFDGTRGNDFATRAEVITMLYKYDLTKYS